jgi:tetratricopeptide (TPR) repeat protein
VLAYLPVAGIVPVYPAIADRALFTPEHFLYLPLLGLVPLVVGALTAAWPPRLSRAAPALLAAVVLIWGAIVVDRNRDWRDEETLFRHTLGYDPPSARVWFNMGNLALAAGRLEEAERLYAAALAREPRDGAAHLNLGITLQRQGRRDAAAEHYRAAITADPTLVEAQRALAALVSGRTPMREKSRPAP